MPRSSPNMATTQSPRISKAGFRFTRWRDRSKSSPPAASRLHLSSKPTKRVGLKANPPPNSSPSRPRKIAKGRWFWGLPWNGRSPLNRPRVPPPVLARRPAPARPYLQRHPRLLLRRLAQVRPYLQRYLRPHPQLLLRRRAPARLDPQPHPRRPAPARPRVLPPARPLRKPLGWW